MKELDYLDIKEIIHIADYVLESISKEELVRMGPDCYYGTVAERYNESQRKANEL